MFASRTTKDVILGNALDGAAVTVTIQRLSWKSLGKARQARTIEQAATLKVFGGDLMLAMREGGADLEAAKAAHEAAKVDPEKRRAARYEAFDLEAVLVAGVTAWSCEGVVRLTPQALGELDDEPARKLFEAILDLSLPPLEAADAEAVEGKDSGRFTST